MLISTWQQLRLLNRERILYLYLVAIHRLLAASYISLMLGVTTCLSYHICYP